MAHDVTVIVLAAGGGTRMKSKTMKVLHPVAGRSMVGHVLTAVRAVQPTQLVAVVGHQRDQVGPHIQQLAPDAVLAVQEVLDGTGGAVRIATQALKPKGTVLVLTGDTPLLEGASLKAFAEEHEAAQRAVSILTGVVERPTGYGRIVRNDEGDVEAIVEEKDASPEQRGIHEINSGILAFEAEFLLSALPRLSNDNANGEFYLTDTVGIAREDGLTVGAYQIHDVRQTEGANDRAQLAELGRELNQRIVERHMRDGVTIVDPATTWIDTDVTIGQRHHDPARHPAARRHPIGPTPSIGPDTTLTDCEVGDGAR
jgi:bifunctional UDP-N-acetylglucosamine pyrophosphorylase/glucosamine-1-phosphate N-acetyltransferase